MSGIGVKLVVEHEGRERKLNLLRQPGDSLENIVNDALNRLGLPRNPPYWVAFSGGKPQRLGSTLAQAFPTNKEVTLELRTPAPANSSNSDKKKKGEAKAPAAPDDNGDVAVEAPPEPKPTPPPPQYDEDEKPVRVEVSVNYNDQDLSLTLERSPVDSLLEILHDVLSELDLPRNPPSWAVWCNGQPQRLILTLDKAGAETLESGVVKIEVIAGEPEGEWGSNAADTALDFASGASSWEPPEGGEAIDLLGSDDGHAAPEVIVPEEDALAEDPLAAMGLENTTPPSPAGAAPFENLDEEAPPPAASPEPLRSRRAAEEKLEALEEEDDRFLPGATVDPSAPATGVSDGEEFADEYQAEVFASAAAAPSPASAARKSKTRAGGGGGGNVSRSATVRYYSRMNPQRAFPLLVVISDAVIAKARKQDVAQDSSAPFSTELGATLEIEPILPGCYCYPPRRIVQVRPGDVEARFCVVPHVEGDLLEPQIAVRQDGVTVAEIPLDVRVAKQTAAWVLGIATVLAPFASVLFRISAEGKSSDTIGVLGGFLAFLLSAVPPGVLGLILLAVTVALYFMFRPQESDQFWEIKSVAPEDVLEGAREAMDSGTPEEALGMVYTLLKTHPDNREGWLWCGGYHYGLGGYEEALECYGRAQTLGALSPNDYAQMIKSASQLNLHERGHALLQEARKKLAGPDFKTLQHMLQA